jgi:hypothetical protein
MEGGGGGVKGNSDAEMESLKELLESVPRTLHSSYGQLSPPFF